MQPARHPRSRARRLGWLRWMRSHLFTCVAFFIYFVLPVLLVIIKYNFFGWLTGVDWVKLMYPNCPRPFHDDEDESAQAAVTATDRDLIDHVYAQVDFLFQLVGMLILRKFHAKKILTRAN